MSESKQVKRKGAILSARQVGIVVALGGLGFAWVALGMYIPLAPPMIWDIREPLVALVGFCAGPWAGAIAGFICGIGTYAPLVDVPIYIIEGFLMGALSKKIYFARKPMNYLALIGITAFHEFLPAGLWGSYAVQILFQMDWWNFYTTAWIPIAAPVYTLSEILAVAIAWRLAPSFMRPRWFWSGGEESAIVEVEK